LLNIDYKIANRHKKVLNTLIHKDQSEFLKGKYIGENVRTLVEIIEHADNSEHFGNIFFSGFSKAFDSLDHRYLFKVFIYTISTWGTPMLTR